jgi:uncharacterized protein
MSETADRFQPQLAPAQTPPPAAALPFPQAKAIAPVWHTVLLLLVIVGFSILPQFVHGAMQASQVATGASRMFTYIATMVYEVLILAWIWGFCGLLYGVPLREIIGGRWSRFSEFLIDIACALLFWIAVVALLAFAHFVLHFSGMDAAKAMLPTTLRETCVFVALSVLAGFCEEIIFRGYFMRQFTAWTKSVAAGVILQAIIFGLGHGYQGWKGMLVISVYGSMFGILAVLRKSLRPGIIQHCAQDGFSGVVAYAALKRGIAIPLIRF